MHKVFGPYRDFWEQCTDYKGATSRGDFWLAIWVNAIVYLLIFGYIFAYRGEYGAVFGILALAVYTVLIMTPLVTLQVRRYHDAGLKGRWLWLTLILPIILEGLQRIWLPRLTLLSIAAGILLLIDLVICCLPESNRASN